ncbi:MAG TPA: LacI family DNA-binding transcriptional regulator [Trebonia sp.]|jgi:LacI family transcriptional regulator|nr:LacI family DNA-binding transcriptional regulator [Trebonia sp.]
MNNQLGIARGASRPTMKDVALRAGVALKTVSRVVNGEAGVTPETTTRVLGAIEELGFRRNESARLLRTGKTATIGFISETWGDREHAALGRGIEEVARERGFLIFAGSTDSDPEREEQLTMSLCARRVDGLIVVPTPGNHDYLISEIEAGIATVFALRPPSLVAADAALVDEDDAARTAVAHLAAHGHKRIGYIGGDHHDYRTRELLRGYRAAMSQARFPVDEAWTRLTPQTLVNSPVSAVLCGSPSHTADTLRSFAGTQNPRQVAMIGFGDFEPAEYLTPGMTVITYDPAEVGRAAAELLFDRLDGNEGPPRQVRVTARLIRRGSAEIPPADA